MKSNNKISSQPKQTVSFLKPVLIGGGIALLLISLFLADVDDPDPEWGTFWMIRPLIVVPLAGAMGGLFYYFMDHLSTQGMNKTVAVVMSLLVYIIGLWLGSILGLVGTLWN